MCDQSTVLSSSNRSVLHPCFLDLLLFNSYDGFLLATVIIISRYNKTQTILSHVMVIYSIG